MIKIAGIILIFMSGATKSEFSMLDDKPVLSAKFAQDVSSLAVDESYADWARNDALNRMSSNVSAGYPLPSQYLVFVDRNVKKQLVAVGYYDGLARAVSIIGWDKCSTGNPAHGGDYHFTPPGMFANTLEHFSYRAAGTKNAYGFRGYGAKGSRVWDFGYQSTTKPIRGVEQWREIRLLMHATDPDVAEKLLGTSQSKGCVRISSKLNKFLDINGIIDSEYEANADHKSVGWLLLKSRTPVKSAGKYLIIGDSAE